MSDNTNSYDEIPYFSDPFPQTQPSVLASVAALLGIEAPPVDHCRVLEIACAGGGNIIPMAQELPGSHFVGIDLSAPADQGSVGRRGRAGAEEHRVSQDGCDGNHTRVRTVRLHHRARHLLVGASGGRRENPRCLLEEPVALMESPTSAITHCRAGTCVA